MKRIVYFFVIIIFCHQISYAMDTNLGIIVFASQLAQLLEDTELDFSEKNAICGICKGDSKDGALDIEWPSDLSKYSHSACYEKIRKSEEPVLTLIKTHITGKDEVRQQKRQDKFRFAFNTAWQKICGIRSLDQYHDKYGERSLAAVGILSAVPHLMLFCEKKIGKKELKCFECTLIKERSHPTYLEYTCAETKIKALRAQQHAITLLGNSLDELHHSITQEVGKELA